MQLIDLLGIHLIMIMKMIRNEKGEKERIIHMSKFIKFKFWKLMSP